MSQPRKLTIQEKCLIVSSTLAACSFIYVLYKDLKASQAQRQQIQDLAETVAQNNELIDEAMG